MATLTSDNLRWMKRYIRRDSGMLRTLKDSGWARPDVEAALQAIEDWNTNGYNTVPTTTLKAEIEAHVGTVTVAQAKVLWYAWSAWRGEFKP